VSWRRDNASKKKWNTFKEIEIERKGERYRWRGKEKDRGIGWLIEKELECRLEEWEWREKNGECRVIEWNEGI
jgi:hypothetical protein